MRAGICRTFSHTIKKAFNGSPLTFTFAISLMLLLSLTAATAQITGAPATMITPVQGTTLTGSSVTFTWTPGTGVTQYVLLVGTHPGGHDVAEVFTGMATTTTVTNVPTGGATLYVALLSDINYDYQYEYYTYTEAGTPAIATLTSPAAGSTLGASATFNWTAGAGVTQYVLYVGTAPQTHDIYYLRGGIGTTSATVSSLPSGVTIYVTLFSLINSTWQKAQYSFNVVPATMVRPVQGSTLPGSTVTFYWTVGGGVTQYAILVGTHPGGHDIAEIFTGQTTGATVSGIPTGGQTIYVQVLSDINYNWQSESYTYTAAP